MLRMLLDEAVETRAVTHPLYSVLYYILHFTTISKFSLQQEAVKTEKLIYFFLFNYRYWRNENEVLRSFDIGHYG